MYDKHNERKKRDACITTELDIIVKQKKMEKNKKNFFIFEKEHIINYHSFKFMNSHIK